MVLLLGALMAVAPPGARAGTYEVVACDAAPGGASSSWVAMPTPTMGAGAACPTNRSLARGMWATNRVGIGTIPGNSRATNEFEAPAGASVVNLTAQYLLTRRDGYWGVGIFADGRMLSGCAANAPSVGCAYASTPPGRSDSFTLPGARRVYMEARCGAAAGCSSSAGPSPLFERASVRVYSATVRVRDDSAPAVWDVHDGALTNGGWQRGRQYVGYAASDNVGIRLARLYVDGSQRDTLARDCDFTRRVPCSDLTYSQYAVDTAALSDGAHSARVEAVDTAGNPASFDVPFKVDNHAPDQPSDVAVDGGEGWRHENGFRLTWKQPPSAAPVTLVHYELCPSGGGACTEGVRRTMLPALDALSVPAAGDYSARIWLEDEAGNANPANRSAPIHLRFDDVAPGEAAPRPHARWLGAAEAEAFDEPIAMKEGAVVPVSGIAGWSVTTDGSEPDGTVDVVGDLLHLGRLPEGTTIVKARAVSGAGVPSAVVGTTVLRVDRTAPDVAALGAPDPGTWSRVPVILAIHGDDQPGLSGMIPAADGDPLEAGAFVSYGLDGRDDQHVRGGSADLTVGDDGRHTVSFSAVDAAGNESERRSLQFKIDRTAPELVVFEQPDSADPRRVVVAAADRTSGIAGGTIELRPIDGGSWRPLATTRSGDRFAATVDDESLARGLYELRARVRDGAGNEAFGDRLRDGSPARIDTAALRADSALSAELVPSGRTAAKPKSKHPRRCRRRPRHGRRCTKPRALATPVAAAGSVPFGHAAAIRGRLVASGSIPVADAVIDVLERSAVPGSAPRKVGEVRTDSGGGFAWSSPAGPSRVVRFVYGGSPRRRGSQAEVTVDVPAAATIRASRRTLRNGRRVVFSGSLRGRPLPKAGKVLDLQAYYRGRWRTFATPRAGTRGAWRYSYRFGATRGRVTYRFRAVVRHESDYPYALGYSNVVSVTVRGR